jgi:hypothetical protein
MKVRVEPPAARERLKADIEALGCGACTVGDVLELSYPAGNLVDDDQPRSELTFFVRAWVSAQSNVVAEVVA